MMTATIAAAPKTAAAPPAYQMDLVRRAELIARKIRRRSPFSARHTSAASSRELTPIFEMISLTCHFAPSRLMSNAVAISALVRPATIRRSTWR
jgi:hypothetical protein